ncbi:MAG TPA: GAF domain-containing protein [Syntrophorhabdaceae bacterium]|nr:GAF domain-containing protein [Syntrophorhabdaceae bacterium]
MQDNQEMRDDFGRVRNEHEIYAELASTLTSSLDHAEILETIMRQVGKLLRPRNWSLMLLDPSNDELCFEIVVGEGAELIKGQRLRLGEGIAGWVAKTGESVLLKDAREDPRFCGRIDQLCNFHTKSLICVPLRNRGKTLGAIELVNRIEQDVFTDLDMKALKTIAEYAAIAINNAHMYKKMHRMALTDDHTCLFNIRCLCT